MTLRILNLVKIGAAICFAFCIYVTASGWIVSALPANEVLRGHTQAISSIAASADGGMIATGSLDQTLRLWDAKSGKQLRVLTGHESEVYAVAFSPDCQLLASSSYNGRVIVWNVGSGKAVHILTVKDWSITLAFSTDSRQLAVGSQDSGIVIFDVRTGKVLRTYETRFSINALAFSPDGRHLAGGSFTIAVWDLQNGKIVKTLEGHRDSLRAIAFSPDSRLLASGSKDKTARLWNLETGETVRTFQTESPVTLRLRTRNLHLKWKMPINSVVFSPDGKLLAAGTGPNIQVWDVATGDAVKTLLGHERSVTGVVFLPDGKSLVSASLDNTARISTIN